MCSVPRSAQWPRVARTNNAQATLVRSENAPKIWHQRIRILPDQRADRSTRPVPMQDLVKLFESSTSLRLVLRMGPAEPGGLQPSAHRGSRRAGGSTCVAPRSRLAGTCRSRRSSSCSWCLRVRNSPPARVREHLQEENRIPREKLGSRRMRRIVLERVPASTTTPLIEDARARELFTVDGWQVLAIEGALQFSS